MTMQRSTRIRQPGTIQAGRQVKSWPLRFLLVLMVAGMTGTSAAALAAGDPVAGKKAFRICATCHTTVPRIMKIGPSLAGVVGRIPGTAPVYPYSPAMKAYGRGGAVWNEATLFADLEAPGRVVKGTKMSFPGLPDPQQRADVIAYLKQFSGR